ncbi:MAG TPA: PD-(D/E)XK nuclease family protein [Solirubrobacteraceae bacterium]|nr:PD-(D/E)XK nuclease family protein [Solirubrobacteraceae bacterium]
MPLTLVTGPANSAKAQVVLDRYRSELARGTRGGSGRGPQTGPILVVPTSADAVHYRRELAQTGAVLGVRVESFGGLIREIGRRAGLGVRPLGPWARERVVAAAIAEARLELLAASAAAPGFLGAATRLVAELGTRRIQPQRLAVALRSWAPVGRRRAYCDEVAAIYSGYRRRLERLGRPDEEQSASASLDAIRIDPSVWGSGSVMLYGFDDLDPLQLDVVETLARSVDVVVSLPYEPGRVAFAGRATTFETLRPAAEEVVELPARADHYEEAGRATLHHLERTLYEEDVEPIDPTGAVGLLEGEGEREELELVGGEIVGLLEAGYGPEEIAVVMRSVSGSEVLIGEVFGELGVGISMMRRIRFADTAVGRGLLGLLRAGLADGGAADLVDWLRTPGVLEHTELVDRFEAMLRRTGINRAVVAARAWEHFPLDGLDRVRAAAERGPAALLERVAGELDRLVAAPWRRRAHVVGAAELAQAKVVGEAARRLGELLELTRADASLGPSPGDLISTLAGLEFEPPPVAGGVVVCDALSLRARRVRAVFVCGLQEGAFPAQAREGPFFSADDRAEIARVSGLVLAPFEDAMAAERYLFYATTSRAQSRLRLSWHRIGDDGGPSPASAFVDDVRDVFCLGGDGSSASEDGDALERLTAAVPDGSAGGRAGLGRIESAGVLEAVGRRRVQSPSALESWAACPVGWFVERLLEAAPLEPAGEALARGNVAHAVLARTMEELCADGPPGTADRGVVGELVDRALAGHAGEVSCNEQRDRAVRRRLAADIERYLVGLEDGSWGHVPAEYELAFGLPGAGQPEVALAGGELVLRGRIDRVDVDRAGGTAIVHDYKTSADVPGRAKWEERGGLAMSLYMLVAGELLGLDVVGGLFQPLRGPDLRPRGALLVDAEPDLAGFPADRVDADELAAAVQSGLERAVRAAREQRAGALEARPMTCSSHGLCRYPSICRSRPVGAGS